MSSIGITTALNKSKIHHSSNMKHLQENQKFELLKPRPLQRGDGIGIFTPSWPANIHIKDKFEHAKKELEDEGFKIIEGNITALGSGQGYRTSSGKDRAEEFMNLITNPEVKCILSTIGGWNSVSLIPHLDYERIRDERKIICGYSDVTSLHFAILKYSGLSTFYGPALVPSFGESPHKFSYTFESFLKISTNPFLKSYDLSPPQTWSDQFIDARDESWKKVERDYQQNPGWKTFQKGEVHRKQAFAGNLETLLSFAGTDFFPDLTDSILIIEETEGFLSKMERNYFHLKNLGVFEQILGLIISKPGALDPPGENKVNREDVLREIIGERPYPIVLDFDCGHTFPMLTIPQGIRLSIKASDRAVKIQIEEPGVET